MQYAWRFDAVGRSGSVAVIFNFGVIYLEEGEEICDVTMNELGFEMA